MGTYMYFVMYPKDKLGLKLLVSIVVAVIVQMTRYQYVKSISSLVAYPSRVLAYEGLIEYLLSVGTSDTAVNDAFLRPMDIAFSAINFITDLLIALVLCITLGARRSAYKDFVGILELVLFLVFPDSYMSNALDFIYGNICTNALLLTLNMRNSLRGTGIKTSTSAEVSAGTLPAAPRARPQNSSFIQMGTMPVQSDIYDDSGFEGRGSAGSKFENNRLKEGSGDESVIRIDGAV
ncbi:hypothetical protein HWV62_32800 [Athelia sp. TMB]|nr:hypothetical protein HWV62_32800 [Athelia sp. TMB]